MVVAVLTVPVVAGAFIWQHPALLTAAGLFEAVLRTLSAQYVDTLPMDSLYLRAARGLVDEFHDPYTKLYTPAEWQRIEASLSGNTAGIGVSTMPEPDGTYIWMVYPGTPAALMGLHIGDKLIQVDTMRFQPGMTLQQTSGHIAGLAGTPVHLTVVRETLGAHADTIQLTLVRAQIHVAAVPFTLLLNGHVGYIPLRQFIPGSANEALAALDTLRRAGATKFILDLRGNPGGWINEAVDLCGIFLPAAQVVARMRGRDDREMMEKTPSTPAAPSEPLVVLVNPGSASASEITAGALQEHDRAVIIGQPTYGKGVTQRWESLPNNYTLEITTQRWYTPLGRSIQRERTLLPGGEYVEVHPESLETAAERLARPKYKSDAGRTLYGGGGIVPDLVMSDTLGAGGALFSAAIKPNVSRIQSMLSSYADSLSHAKTQQPHVTVAMRATFLHHLRMAGIVLPKSVVTLAGPFIDRMIAERVALNNGNRQAAKRARLSEDLPLTLALETLQQAVDQASLFTVVQKHQRGTR